MITRQEAVALTELVRTQRAGWDALATINVLTTLTGDLADIAYCAIRTAQDPTMRTPVALRWEDNPHKRPTIRETTPRAMPIWEDTARLAEIARCHWCDQRGYLPNGYICQHEDPDDRARRAARRADQARAQIRPAPRPQEPA